MSRCDVRPCRGLSKFYLCAVRALYYHRGDFASPEPFWQFRPFSQEKQHNGSHPRRPEDQEHAAARPVVAVEHEIKTSTPPPRADPARRWLDQAQRGKGVAAAQGQGGRARKGRRRRLCRPRRRRRSRRSLGLMRRCSRRRWMATSRSRRCSQRRDAATTTGWTALHRRRMEATPRSSTRCSHTALMRRRWTSGGDPAAQCGDGRPQRDRRHAARKGR